jgi:hypothetical protein
MRLLFLPLLLTALPAAASPQEAVRIVEGKQPGDPAMQPILDACKRADVHEAEAPKPAESRKLGELPPGDVILSVYTQVGGCMEPMIVRYGEGRGPAPAAPEPVRPRARLWQ